MESVGRGLQDRVVGSEMSEGQCDPGLLEMECLPKAMYSGAKMGPIEMAEGLALQVEVGCQLLGLARGRVMGSGAA